MEEENETHIIYIHNECNPIVHGQTHTRTHAWPEKQNNQIHNHFLVVPNTRYNQQVQFTFFNAFLIIQIDEPVSRSASLTRWRNVNQTKDLEPKSWLGNWIESSLHQCCSSCSSLLTLLFNQDIDQLINLIRISIYHKQWRTLKYVCCFAFAPLSTDEKSKREATHAFLVGNANWVRRKSIIICIDILRNAFILRLWFATFTTYSPPGKCQMLLIQDNCVRDINMIYLLNL